ncbi:hypothetical protein BU26DRAFT_507578 [Trematosphaeria pertusa]|uniref:Uncharacterized protein n=1 Tax=Trematosphaeria pertusa TaxID=390896 RepID=A0A6A6I8Q9_9PLEO|nr:uncharacterized protein BU26DRAFT_507578 [Trematosphaeria pertusa]KAF2245910.1 hypothetical protein BU26DRAFT_507578 [Trematosphaeria pertusa]
MSAVGPEEWKTATCLEIGANTSNVSQAYPPPSRPSKGPYASSMSSWPSSSLDTETFALCSTWLWIPSPLESVEEWDMSSRRYICFKKEMRSVAVLWESTKRTPAPDMLLSRSLEHRHYTNSKMPPNGADYSLYQNGKKNFWMVARPLLSRNYRGRSQCRAGETGPAESSLLELWHMSKRDTPSPFQLLRSPKFPTQAEHVQKTDLEDSMESNSGSLSPMASFPGTQRRDPHDP